MKITFSFAIKHCADLTCGYKGKHIEFKHKPYEERSVADRLRYDRLRDHIRDNGMLNPIAVFRNHVIVGQRRFEIMKNYTDLIECIEIEQDLTDWPINRVTEITNAIKIYYHQNEQKRQQTIPRNL